jgi:hypothetical protein
LPIEYAKLHVRCAQIPAWARGQVLAAALERQFNVSAGGSWVDPDTIFPEVTTCNLEEIFKVRVTRAMPHMHIRGKITLLQCSEGAPNDRLFWCRLLNIHAMCD